MGSRYLFIVLYTFLERHLAKGDYHRAQVDSPRTAERRARAARGDAPGRLARLDNPREGHVDVLRVPVKAVAMCSQPDRAHR